MRNRVRDCAQPNEAKSQRVAVSHAGLWVVTVAAILPVSPDVTIALIVTILTVVTIGWGRVLAQ